MAARLLTLLVAGFVAGGCGDNLPGPGLGADAGVVADAGAADAGSATGPDGAVDAALPFAIDPQRLYEDVALLASGQMGGRAPGTPGNAAALTMVEDRFAALGLVPVGDDETYRQAFTFNPWRLTGPPELTLAGALGAPGSDYTVFIHSGSGVASEEVVFVGYGLTVPPFDPAAYPACPLDPAGYDDFAGIDVTDKIALVLRRGPQDHAAIYNSCPANEACASTPCLWDFGYKAQNARLHGAAAMLLTQLPRQGSGVEPGILGEDYYAADFPALFVDRGFVEAALPDLETWAAAVDDAGTPQSHDTGVTATVKVVTSTDPVTTRNLLGAVPGSDPDRAHEVVVVGAHVDHLGIDPVSGELYPGADDNASGTAVMLELARGLAASEPPARTVLFASWNAEEAGVIGSCFYVSEPAYPMHETFAMFSIDMVGAGNGSGLMIAGGLEPQLAWIVDVFEGARQEEELAGTVSPAAPLLASDHYCFYVAGVPAVLATTPGAHAYYHTPGDTIDTIVPEDLETAARLMWSGLRPLAQGREGDYTERAPGQEP